MSSTSDSSFSSVPADRDVLNQDVEGQATAQDAEMWDAEMAGFIRSGSGLSDQWVGKRPLGKGSFGMAGLWEKDDGDGRPVKASQAYGLLSSLRLILDSMLSSNRWLEAGMGPGKAVCQERLRL